MQLSYAQGSADVPLLTETVGENLEHTTARFPDRDALIVRHQGIRCTYREFDDATDRLAKSFLRLGVQLGDRVGMWGPNSAEWVGVQYATAKIGAILVNVNPAYRSSELEYVLNQSGCRFLISAPSYLTSDYRSMVAEVEAAVPGLERTIFLDSAEWNDLFDAGDAIPDEELWQRESLLDADQPISTRRAQRASRRAPRSPIATFSTTATSAANVSDTPSRTGCAFPSRSITVSGW